MKISNSKKQLAKIIHENGGWSEGAEFSAQDKDGEVFHYASRPSIGAGAEVWNPKGCIGCGEFEAKTLRNWHQTILSRDEYFHLYPEQDADGWIEWSGGGCPVGGGVLVDLKWSDGFEPKAAKPEAFRWQHLDSRANIIAYRLHKPEPAPQQAAGAKPTIEQLAADYRNRKDYADRKQQEADAAKADAEAKLAELVAAGKALGLVLRILPAAKTFHNRKVGIPETYTADISREVCDGCGQKAGDHFGRAMFCEHKDCENA